jgi:hypothetical protein
MAAPMWNCERGTSSIVQSRCTRVLADANPDPALAGLVDDAEVARPQFMYHP